MLGTARLITFAIRSLALLILVSILWVSAAKEYNHLLAAIAQPFAPENVTIRTLGLSLIFDNGSTQPFSLDTLTLHFGLILMVVVVLAAVGVKALPRIGWLTVFAIGAFLSHVAGMALLANGNEWAGGSLAPDESSRMILSAFAVFWGLIPALVCGVWCFAYWLPRATATNDATIISALAGISFSSLESNAEHKEGDESLDPSPNTQQF